MTIKSNRFHFSAPIVASALFILLSACNKQAEPQAALPAAVGTKAHDTAVTAKVKTALLSDDYVNGLDIKVETNKGEVMLSGFVDNQSQINQGVAIARDVKGVTGIDNKLAVTNGTSSIGNKLDDSVVTAKVKSALLKNPAMKSVDIAVETNKGNVQLSGFVDNENQQKRAVAITNAVEGVAGVSDEMSIKK